MAAKPAAKAPAKPAAPAKQTLPAALVQAGYKLVNGNILTPEGATIGSSGPEGLKGAIADATTGLSNSIAQKNGTFGNGMQPSPNGGTASAGTGGSAPVAPSTGSTGAGTPASTTPSAGTPTGATPTSAGPAQGGSLNDSNQLNPSSLLSSGINPLFQNIADQATTGVTQDFNTAANRLRERTDASTAGNVQSATDKNLSRGFGTSGAQNADVVNAQAAGTNTYAQGLDTLSNQFEQNKLAGLNTALGATNGEAQNSNTEDTTLYNALNNQDQRNSNQTIANNSNNTEKSVDSANNTNSSNIAQLQQQMAAWMATQNQGSAY